MHHVLADLCQQLACDTKDDCEEESETSDFRIFESILQLEHPRSEEEDPDQDHAESPVVSINHVYVTGKSCDIPSSGTFQGVRIDSAAQKSVIGASQAHAYCSLFDVSFQPSSTRRRNVFSFGTHKHFGLGLLIMQIPITSSHFLPITVDVCDADVPFLLGLDNMELYKMVLDTDKCVLSSRLQGWNVPFEKKLGHLYYEWGPQILFTETELMKMHRHFHHPDSERLYSFMKSSDPGKTSPQVLTDLKRISAACDLCQRLSHAPHRFRVALPDGEVVFNKTVCLDLMYLDNAAVLHVVDKDTKFSAATFLSNETAKETWNTFMRIRVCTYIGFPDVMATDQGPQFKSDRWSNLLNLAGITHHPSGFQSHNAFGVGERYHSFLRGIYRKARQQHPQLENEHILALSVMAMNDTAGYHVLVPTLLVFGAMPRLLVTPMDLPAQVDRMKAMVLARKEMTRIIAKERIPRALRTNVPSAAHTDIPIGSRVLIFREKPENKWIGPYRVLDVKDKCLFIDLDGTDYQVSLDEVKA